MAFEKSKLRCRTLFQPEQFSKDNYPRKVEKAIKKAVLQKESMYQKKEAMKQRKFWT